MPPVAASAATTDFNRRGHSRRSSNAMHEPPRSRTRRNYGSMPTQSDMLAASASACPACNTERAALLRPAARAPLLRAPATKDQRLTLRCSVLCARFERRPPRPVVCTHIATLTRSHGAHRKRAGSSTPWHDNAPIHDTSIQEMVKQHTCKNSDKFLRAHFLLVDGHPCNY